MTLDVDIGQVETAWPGSPTCCDGARIFVPFSECTAEQGARALRHRVNGGGGDD
jgi:hypothetical protein